MPPQWGSVGVVFGATTGSARSATLLLTPPVSVRHHRETSEVASSRVRPTDFETNYARTRIDSVENGCLREPLQDHDLRQIRRASAKRVDLESIWNRFGIDSESIRNRFEIDLKSILNTNFCVVYFLVLFFLQRF